MCVILFDVFKHLLLRKTDVLKTCRKSKFLGKKIWRNALALKSKKVQGILGKIFILVLSSAVFRLQNGVSDFFQILLFGRLKTFIKWGWFQGHYWTLPQISWLKNKISKNWEKGFVDQRALTTTILIFSCHWKTLVTFCLQKKRLENA